MSKHHIEDLIEEIKNKGLVHPEIDSITLKIDDLKEVLTNVAFGSVMDTSFFKQFEDYHNSKQ